MVSPSNAVSSTTSTRSSRATASLNDRRACVSLSVSAWSMTPPEHVVDQQHATRADPGDQLLPVAGVSGLVGIDEHQVKNCLDRQGAQRLQGGPEAQLDAISQTRLLPRANPDGRPFLADRALAATDAALLEAVSPPTGQSVLITNAEVDRLTADLRAAESNLDAAQHAHRAIPARLPLAQVNPGQQVLDIQTKLISHAIRIAAFNTATAMARDVRVHTGYARANHEAHTLIRQALTGSGDIDPGDGVLTIRLDPLMTGRATAAIAQLCEHLTATQTRYPGTDFVLRYEVKTHP